MPFFKGEEIHRKAGEEIHSQADAGFIPGTYDVVKIALLSQILLKESKS